TVTAADGIPVLAHPLKNLVFEELDQIAAMGLAGMETTHPAHNQATCRQLEDFSVTRGLFTTGGSDFHGPGPYQRPDFNPASLLAALRTARENATNEDTNVQ
ncbi:hypothetical protein H8D51_04290, partial [bacterium]|nr:hypothetical protein [bacterium]